jgi:ribosomal protein L21
LCYGVAYAQNSFEEVMRAMFAIVRTGGKQYRVAAGDKIVVEKMAGEAGDAVSLGDVLLAGEGSELKSLDGLTVSAEIIAQAKPPQLSPQERPSPAAHDPADHRDRRSQGAREGQAGRRPRGGSRCGRRSLKGVTKHGT